MKYFETKNIDKWGGYDNYLAVFTAHYTKLMNDPFTNELFDMRSLDTAVLPSVHGKRLGTFFMTHFGDSYEYHTYRKVEHDFVHLNPVH